MKYDSFIYGKDQTEGVVSVEVMGDKAQLFLKDGSTREMKNEYYILYPDENNQSCVRLLGNLHYKYAEKFTDQGEYRRQCAILKARDIDHFTIFNPAESFMVKNGVTYYKGMTHKEPKILSFDIETTGLHADTSKLLLISNTFRNGDKVERRLFRYDDYKSEKEMVYAWCSYVQSLDPDILTGHNIYGFDLPYLNSKGGGLPIGRNKRPVYFPKRPSLFRKDGSQSYDYFNAQCFGREIIDTFFLSIKFDVTRKYESYKLKTIIRQEGLEKKDREHYNAATIKDNYTNALEWDKICKYAEHDADDALALYDLMIPAFFYYCQHIPKTMQQVINGASGSQINSFMLRAYLSEAHSIPKSTQTKHYEGGISFGNPGIYKYVGKVDVASLYPSIILEEGIYDKNKDPKGLFLKMVQYFTKERLTNKRLANTTGQRYYRDLEQAQKIIINSAYGFMGAPRLNFNSPDNAALVTASGRRILERGLEFAKSKGWTIVNADTDSFSFTTGRPFTPTQFEGYIEELNKEFPDKIKWEDDGRYTKVIIVKAKNYVLKCAESGKITIKGSALKATMKEPALKKMIVDIIDDMLEDKNGIGNIYKNYVRSAFSIGVHNIKEWTSKKTVTKSVLTPKRTNEQRIKDAIDFAGLPVQEGDKIYTFFEDKTTVRLVESFKGTICTETLIKKIYKTLEVFSNVLNMDDYPKLHIKKNKGLLDEIVSTPQETGEL